MLFQLTRIILHSILFLIAFPFSTKSESFKLLRWECNSSGISIIGTKCRARSLSRNHQVVDFEFELKQEIHRMKARYVGMVKPMNGQNWRQFLKFENIDLCGILGGGFQNDYIQSIKENYMLLFPGLPTKCPIEKKKYFAKNITLIQTKDDVKKHGIEGPDANLSPKLLPNGIYRHTLRFYSNNDPEGFMVYWHIQIYDTMGEDRF